MQSRVGHTSHILAVTALGVCILLGSFVQLGAHEGTASGVPASTLTGLTGSAAENTFGPPPRGASIKGSVEGRILDETGQPVKGVRIQARKPGEPAAQYETESDELGRYEFSEINPGLYILEGERPGFETARRVVIVAYEGRSTMDIILPPEAPR